MKKCLGLPTIFFVVLIIVLATSSKTARALTGSAPLSRPQRACTMEAELCPDGSSVSRGGPNCEFALCPNSSNPSPLPKLKVNGNISRAAATQKLEDIKSKINQEKNSAKAKNEKARIDGRENALIRFDAAVIRINNLIKRVNVEISTLEARGVDGTSAKKLLMTAETKLADANTKITEISTLLSASIAELSAADKANLISLAKDTQTLIKDSHQALKDAINSLKDNVKLKMEAEANAATSTNQ